VLKSAPPVFGVDVVPPAWVCVPGVAAPPVWAVLGAGVAVAPPEVALDGAAAVVGVVVVAVVLVCEEEEAEALPDGGAVSTGVVFGTS
jgi:hypothetical protein